MKSAAEDNGICKEPAWFLSVFTSEDDDRNLLQVTRDSESICLRGGIGAVPC